MNGRLLIGFVLLFVGVGIVLDIQDVWDFGAVIGDWWPLILVAAGLLHLAREPRSVWGWVLVAVGTLLILIKQDVIPSIGPYIWPIVLIVLGLVLVFGTLAKRSRQGAGRGARRGGRPSRRVVDTDHVSASAFFGGANERVRSQAFRGGSASAVFGGVELDLRETRIADGGADLDVTAAFGGVTVFVPRTMHVKLKGTPAFGGFENKAETAADGPLLHIHGLALFGAVEVRNDPKT